MALELGTFDVKAGPNPKPGLLGCKLGNASLKSELSGHDRGSSVISTSFNSNPETVGPFEELAGQKVGGSDEAASLKKGGLGETTGRPPVSPSLPPSSGEKAGPDAEPRLLGCRLGNVSLKSKFSIHEGGSSVISTSSFSNSGAMGSFEDATGREVCSGVEATSLGEGGMEETEDSREKPP